MPEVRYEAYILYKCYVAYAKNAASPYQGFNVSKCTKLKLPGWQPQALQLITIKYLPFVRWVVRSNRNCVGGGAPLSVM